MKKQTNKTTSKSSSRKVKFKFDAKSDVVQKQNFKYKGENMELKTIFNPKKADFTMREDE